MEGRVIKSLITSGSGVEGRRSSPDRRSSADRSDVVSTEIALTSDREQPPPINIS